MKMMTSVLFLNTDKQPKSEFISRLSLFLFPQAPVDFGALFVFCQIPPNLSNKKMGDTSKFFLLFPGTESFKFC